MIKLKTIVLCIFMFVFSPSVFATTRYIATSAGVYSGGTACDGQTAITVTTFNAATLAADDIAYVCGTLSASAGANGFIKPKNGGTSGHPIQIIFDTSGILTATYWGAATGAIEIGFSYVVIDGAGVGIIQATANGNSPKANNQGSRGIYIAASTQGVEIKSLIIKEIYVHTKNGTNGGQPDSECIADAGSTNLSIHGNTISDCYYGISRIAGGPATSGYNWYSNTLSKTNWSFKLTAAGSGETISNTYIHDNDFEIGNEWDDLDTNYNHHNGLYAFTDVPGVGQITGLYFYNNYGHGVSAGGWTSTSMAWTSYAVRSIYFFNNLLGGNSGDPSDAYIACEYGSSANTCFMANNTIVGSSATAYTAYGGTITPRCFNITNNSSTTATIQNTICYTVAQGTLTTAGSTFTQNYDNVNNITNYGVVNGTFYTAYSGGGSWQAAGYDTNGSNGSPSLSASYTLNAGSAAIGLATNLYSTCNGQSVPGLGALCLDKNGVTRPSGGAWDAGAIQYSSVPAPTPGGSGVLTITNKASTTITLNWTAASCTGTCQYEVGQSTSPIAAGVTACEATSIIRTFTNSITSFDVTSLTPLVHYYWCVVVLDDSTLKAAYTPTDDTTLCVPTYIAYTSQPVSAALGASIGTVTIGVYVAGVLCTGASSSVTLSGTVGNTWNGLASVLNPTLTKTVSSGLASWTDLKVNTTIGVGTITAASSGLTSGISSNIAIGTAPVPVSGIGGGIRTRWRVRGPIVDAP